MAFSLPVRAIFGNIRDDHTFPIKNSLKRILNYTYFLLNFNVSFYSQCPFFSTLTCHAGGEALGKGVIKSCFEHHHMVKNYK